MRKYGHRVVFYAPNDVRAEELRDMPTIDKEEMLVEVEACAICGSDIKAYLNGNLKITPPRVIGHEFCGRIVEIGSFVSGYSIGERVTMATTIGCGECECCKKGSTNLCNKKRAMGFYYDGAMSKYVVIPEDAIRMGNIVQVGALSPEVAALAEPMSCVMNSLSKVPMDEIENAVVIGLGALGIFHTIALRNYGVKNIIGVDFPGAKKKIVNDIGFNTKTPDEFEDQYLELSNQQGFDLVIITAPSKKAQSQAPKYAGKLGHVSYFASLPVSEEMITISSRILHYNELCLYGTSDSTVKHVKSALKILVEQEDTVKRVITKLPLEDFMKGVQGVLNMDYAKVVLIP